MLIPNKTCAMLPGISHASFQQKNYLMVYDILMGFLARRELVYHS